MRLARPFQKGRLLLTAEHSEGGSTLPQSTTAGLEQLVPMPNRASCKNLGAGCGMVHGFTYYWVSW